MLLTILASLVLAAPQQTAPTRAPLAGRATSPAVPAWRMDVVVHDVQDWDAELHVQLSEIVGARADLYVRRGAPPTRRLFDFRSATPGTSDELVVVSATTSPELTSGAWYIGVWRPDGTLYHVDHEGRPAPSGRPGVGALPWADASTGARGTTFRVWAPFAQEVLLRGSFNGWSSTATPLASEGAGFWSLDVRDVAPGAQYRYRLRNGGTFLERNDPRARDVTNSVGNSIVVDHGTFAWTASVPAPAWNDMIVYELHVGTFNDLPGGAPGTFSSAIQRLDHLQDLGVNVVELMPVAEFAADYSWGYNGSHVFAPESAYGGVDDLKRFVDEAAARGIAVLHDVVYNHLGPSDLPTWRFDGWSQNGYGGIYFYNDARAQTPWGDTRPDYGRPEVRAFLHDAARSWLDDYRMGGLRVDSTVTMRRGPLGDIPDGWALMQQINDSIDATAPWKISIAEDLQNDDWITRATSLGGAGFDSQWDARFVHPVRAALEDPSDANRNMWSVRDAIAARYNADAFERVIYTESHDEVANGRTRVPEAIWPGNAASYYSKKRSTLGAGLVMTSPGIPMLFQGQEILEDGWFADTDPVDWSKEVTFAGIEALYRDLIHLRRDFSGQTLGLKGQGLNVHHVNDGAKMIAFHRWMNGGPGDDVVVIANFANQTWGSYTIGFPRGGTWHVRFNSDAAAYDPGFGNHPSGAVQAVPGSYDGQPYRGDFSIGPYTLLVLSQ